MDVPNSLDDVDWSKFTKAEKEDYQLYLMCRKPTEEQELKYIQAWIKNRNE